MDGRRILMLLTMIMAALSTGSCLDAMYCNSATGTCYFSFGTGTTQNAITGYSTNPLDTENAKIRTAVIVIHGTDRNAGQYFETAAGVVVSNHLAERVAVVAPHFQCAEDKPVAGTLYWTCENWKDGGPAVNDSSVYSFTVIDRIIEKLKAAFPNLTRITVTGHSAGGQFAQRYAAANTVDVNGSGVPVRYVPANPSSYVYLDSKRIKKSALCTDETNCPLTADSFETPYWNAGSSEECGKYNQYKYGLENRDGYYIGAPLTAEKITSQYIARDVVYLLGNKDNNKDSEYSVLDVSCQADAQGPFNGPSEHSYRLQRGLTYYRYVTELFSAGHSLSIVPGCKHDEACMYKSKEALSAIFQ
jgi:phosphohistidine swiveling domain-containing protein